MLYNLLPFQSHIKGCCVRKTNSLPSYDNKNLIVYHLAEILHENAERGCIYSPHHSFLVAACHDGQVYRMRTILLLGLTLGTNLHYPSRLPSPPQDLLILPNSHNSLLLKAHSSHSCPQEIRLHKHL